MTEPRDLFQEHLLAHPVQPLPPDPDAFDRIASSARRRRWAKAAGTCVAVLVLLVGVASAVTSQLVRDRGVDSQPTVSAAVPSQTPPSVVSPAPVASSAAGTPPVSHSPTATPTATGRCTAADLRVGVVPGDSAAGHIGLTITFTNTSNHTCTLFGYPGVSFLTSAHGTQINNPAQRSPAQGNPTTITLKPNTTAHANLLLTNTANYPPNTCKPVTAAGIRTYPPNDTTAIFTPTPQTICSTKGIGTAQIYPVHSGA